jgi:hypothetical protein
VQYVCDSIKEIVAANLRGQKSEVRGQRSAISNR